MRKTCPKCSRRIRVRKERAPKCACGYEFTYSKCFGAPNEVYLIDTNIFLYALNHEGYFGEYCNEVLNNGSSVATTRQVIEEIRQPNNYRVRLYDVKEISKEVKELHYDTAEDLSFADRSLIQCAIDHPEVIGIISYDYEIGVNSPRPTIN